MIIGGERRNVRHADCTTKEFDADTCRRAARAWKDGPHAWRLLALAAVYWGESRSEAARIGGVTVQIVRDWVVKFNAHGPAGLIAGSRPDFATDNRAGGVRRGARDRSHGGGSWS